MQNEPSFGAPILEQPLGWIVPAVPLLTGPGQKIGGEPLKSKTPNFCLLSVV